ncbi:MAG: [protein-PII] uridylyltransferase [Nitrospirae bacterium RIFCSPLOWO2_01_FULL_62_17]|nr:MAG: [protein-PII] uridylyltransferase [Nitrospirae bacterium RIFCSPLOWO2_01_FULL_62_17]
MDVQSSALTERREVIQQRLLEGASGAEVMDALTELVDGLIIGRYRNGLRQLGEAAEIAASRSCCLVALGGYGRRELAPHSDIDLMVLFKADAKAMIPELVKTVLHPLWDAGFQVGHSVRTIQECLELAEEDLTIRTSMMEARFLAGSATLFQEFHDRYTRQIVSKGVDRFIDQKLEVRRREYEKFGETVYLLEPNVKKSKGGLRDLHVLQWIGMARYRAATIRELADRGILSRQDYRALTEARDFLWRVRALMHVHAGSAQEILTFDEQMWLAQRFGYQDRPHLLAVEQFMQVYYRHTMGLNERMMRFVKRCRTVSLWSRLTRLLPAPRIDRHFVAQGSMLTVPVEERTRVLDSPGLLLKLFDVARARALEIDPELIEDIPRHVESLPASVFDNSDVCARFVKILAGPRTASTLDAMHRAHLLERLIPVFATVRGLMQFNQYHKYTVDEHSLLAVARAEAFEQESGMIGQVYREIPRKDLLHLAVLLHDLGKGREEDHSEVGKRLAEETAARLGFDEQDTRALVFLVHKHLLMAHTAFRRDPYDGNVLLTFAREVGTPAVLRKFLVLTAADIAAVGPGVLTKWKESLLIELYLRTMPEVSGEKDASWGSERIAQLVREVAARMPEQPDAGWVQAQLEHFPLRYVHGTAPERIAGHLTAIHRLSPRDVKVESAFNEALGTCDYAVITRNDVIPGIFSKIAGVLAAMGLHVLDAQIVTRRDDVIVDTFQVNDPDFAGVPPAERREDVGRALRSVLLGEETVEQLMGRYRRLDHQRRLPTGRQSTDVQVDNETSDRATIIDVFAEDRQGLLYVITRTIFTLGLSVQAARISTRLDQVADVFYVTDSKGGKVTDPARLEAIRATLKGEIDRFVLGRMRVDTGTVPGVSLSTF